jgi:hypothetical protein
MAMRLTFRGIADLVSCILRQSMRGYHTMLRYQPDLAVRNERGNIVANVEVRGQENITSEEAARIRRTVIEHDPDLSVPFFAIITPRNGFIWRSSPADAADSAHLRPPDVTFSTTSLIDRYLPGPRPPGVRNGAGLDLAVYQWLTELTHGLPPDANDADVAWSRAGLVDAAKDGSIDLNFRE